MTKVLFIISAANHWMLNDNELHPTGHWGEEVAEPHQIFHEAGMILRWQRQAVECRRWINSVSA